MTVGLAHRQPQATVQMTPDLSPILEDAVAWWKAADYSGSGNLLDGSGNGHHLTISGPAFASGAFTFVTAESDYMEAADHADFDFGAADGFTIAVACSYTAPGANAAVISKRSSLATTAVEAGWIIRASNAGMNTILVVDDGAATSNAAKTATSGVPGLVAGVRSIKADNLKEYAAREFGTPTTDATTGTLANAYPLRIGRLCGAGGSYFSMTFYGAAIFRRSLTAAELARVAAQFGVAA